MYEFDLPNELIAQKPASPRDSAKLLVYRMSDGQIMDSVFSDLNSFLHQETTLVINNSKVDNCRWLFDKKIELFVLEKTDTNTVRAMVRPGKKFKVGDKIRLTEWLNVETLDIDNEGIRTLRLSVEHDDPRLKKFEHVPLPPYIKQDDSLSGEYQTVYAKPLGSLAAPTAGLHFTDSLLEDISKSHKIAEVTLHVGLGTFAKLNDDNLATGKLHEELFSIDDITSKTLNESSHVTAVGTTSIRTLESAADKDGSFVAKAGGTDIFIRPG